MVTKLNVWTDTAVDISCEVHVISFRGGRLTSLTIHFRTRRVYLFSKLLVSHKVHSTPTNHARIIEHTYSYTCTRRFISLSVNKWLVDNRSQTCAVLCASDDARVVLCYLNQRGNYFGSLPNPHVRQSRPPAASAHISGSRTDLRVVKQDY